MEGRFFLNVVIGKSATILELFTSEDQPLLVWWNPLFILDLGFDVIDGVGRFDLKRDSLACQRLDKDLHTTSKSENQVKS